MTFHMLSRVRILFHLKVTIHDFYSLLYNCVVNVLLYRTRMCIIDQKDGKSSKHEVCKDDSKTNSIE